MAHVQITNDAPDTYRVIVDGVDLSNAVLVEGFNVTLPEQWGDPARVHLVIAADTLDADLPNVVIEALRADAEDEGRS